MIEKIERSIMLLGKPVHTSLCITDWGIEVLIAGGDRPHIGAVTVIDDRAHLNTQVFEGHKDDFISEEWAKILHRHNQVPVVISVGIHYDEIDAENIQMIVSEMHKQLDEIILHII